MFTGLIEQRGTLAGRTRRGPGARLRVHGLAPSFLVLGESIAVDGVCLTVDAITPEGFEADASAETLERTTLGALELGSGVNLERALAVGGRLGGHIVGGHVDVVSSLVEKRPLGDAVELDFALPAVLAHLVAEKGSVAVNGVSLTVNRVTDALFSVVLIPASQRVTQLHTLRPGARVNLEADVLARYVARLAATLGPPAMQLGTSVADSGAGTTDSKKDALWEDLLSRAGYM